MKIKRYLALTLLAALLAVSGAQVSLAGIPDAPEPVQSGQTSTAATLRHTSDPRVVLLTRSRYAEVVELQRRCREDDSGIRAAWCGGEYCGRDQLHFNGAEFGADSTVGEPCCVIAAVGAVDRCEPEADTTLLEPLERMRC